MRTEALRIAGTNPAIVFNASEKNASITVDKRKYNLQPAEWMHIKETIGFSGSNIAVSADCFYCMLDQDGDLELWSYPLKRPPKEEASLQIIHGGTGRLTAKARYGDTFPSLNPGSSTSPITLFVPMDVVIDFYESTEHRKGTYHYVTKENQAGMLLYTGSCLYFIEIFPSH
ncbi:hypothetical protein SAMN05421743_112137 [Thalassobacillus cyri]|uniref:Uncharacterized protein n=2 Tax=Thalassobacillus cyri TaxID=571932 RepID=A0A1H4FW94_9BACI|nr:hypothetical protein SAMN05421743_112137 [Thalassobacillus cyri]